MAAAEGAPAQAPAGEGDWRRILFAMMVVQFIMGVSITVASPMLPLFLPELGIRSPSALNFWAGLLGSVNFLVAAFASPIWGALADRRGRKAMVLRSSLAIAVFNALIGCSTAVWQVLILRAAQGAFSGFSAAAIALVATAVPEDRLGYALGWLATSQLVGTLIGPVVGGVIADGLGSYRAVFFCTSVLATVAVVVALLLVKDRRPGGTGRTASSPLANLRLLLRSPGLLPLFGVLLMAQFGVRSVQPVVAIFVQQLVGDVPTVATLAGVAFSVTGVADLIASPFLGKRSDVIGYRRVLLISLAGAAAASLPQAFVHSYWSFVAARFALGMFVGGLLPTANALVGRRVSSENRGALYGLTASATFVGSFAGPLAGGSIAALFGIRWVFVLTTAMFLANFVWIRRYVPETVESDAA